MERPAGLALWPRWADARAAARRLHLYEAGLPSVGARRPAIARRGAPPARSRQGQGAGGMKRTLLLLTAMAFATPAAAADITGIWATGSEGGRVEIYRCGKALCGKVIDEIGRAHV